MMRPSIAWSLVPLALLSACSNGGGGGSGTPVPASFKLLSLNVPSGGVWQLNRQIEFTFTRDVDLSSVDGMSIRLLDSGGVPAVGSYRFAQEDTNGDGFPDSTVETRLVFEPSCPVLEDLSDAGLLPNIGYTLELPAGPNALLAADGTGLEEAFSLQFSTPALPPFFLDTQSGPPAPVLRAVGSASTSGTHVRLGGDMGARAYFEYDVASQAVSLSPVDTELGLGLYSSAASTPVFFVVLDQQLTPSAANLAVERVRLEADVPGVGLRTWPALVTLESNCISTGAVLRLEPMGGPLPRGGTLRAVLGAGLQDLAGETLLLDLDSFATAPIEVPSTLDSCPPRTSPTPWSRSSRTPRRPAPTWAWGRRLPS